jgi:hypothetical protein
MKKLLAFAIVGLISSLSVGSVNAQTTSYWSQCTDGASIVRCETYNCPNGDSNKDGVCDLKDSNATLSDTRNDSFCANPPSGCGQVLYYAQNQNLSCAVRVKQNENSCNLYKAGNPNFTSPTPAPTLAPTATPVSRLSSSPVATASAKPTTTKTTLPKTGAELWVSIFLAGLGMYGLYLYEKPRRDTE